MRIIKHQSFRNWHLLLMAHLIDTSYGLNSSYLVWLIGLGAIQRTVILTKSEGMWVVVYFFLEFPLLLVLFWCEDAYVKKQRNKQWCAVNVDTVLLLSLSVRTEVFNRHGSPLMMAQVKALENLEFFARRREHFKMIHIHPKTCKLIHSD